MLFEVVNNKGVGFFVEFKTKLGDKFGGSLLSKKFTFSVLP